MRFAIGVLLCIQAGIAAAQSPTAPEDWLGRIYQATQRLSYNGIFVYQQGNRTETSRITHLSDARGGIDRLEVLDGARREILRTPDVVRCYFPEHRTIKIDQTRDRRGFPALVPQRHEKLLENYRVVLGQVQRVAGFECQEVMLTPRDTLRYGYRLCADLNTAMLLKAIVFDEAGAVIEQFTFTQWMPGKVTREQLKPRYATSAWRIEDASVMAADLAKSGWMFSVDLPGFEKVAEVTRKLGKSRSVGQVVFSDGIAAVSVFLEPAEGNSESAEEKLAQMGAVHMYTREIGTYVITAVGEVPAASVRRVAHGVEMRQPR